MGCGTSSEIGLSHPQLPQALSADKQKERAKRVAETRDEYELCYPYGGKDSSPAWVKELPERETTAARTIEFNARVGVFGIIPTQIEGHVRSKLSQWTECLTGRDEELQQDPFKKYDYIYSEDELPPVAHVWRTDASFADQRVNGLYPEYIERCRELPADVAEQAEGPVRELALLPEGKTLAAAAAEGLLYQTDLRHFVKGAPGREDNDIVTSPIAFFYSDVPNKRLVPVAIQLQVGGTVFTPQDDADGSNRWLVAKMHVNRAQWSLYVSVTHWLYLHQVLGRMYIGMRRQLADEHPLWQLVARHFDNHLSANATARVSEDFDNRRARFQGMTEWTRAASLPGGHMAWLELPRNLEQRGVMDAAALPNFHFRDEGMKQWRAFEALCAGVVAAIYGGDADVAADYELQEWVADVTGDEGGITGLPLDADGKLATCADLVRVLTTMIFNVATKHSLTLTAGDDLYAYIPNAPTVLAVEPPADHERRYTLHEICAGLPPDADAIWQHATIAGLQLEDMYPLLPPEPGFLKGVPGGDVLAQQFAAAMQRIEDEAPADYSYLRPSRMARSVWN